MKATRRHRSEKAQTSTACGSDGPLVSAAQAGDANAFVSVLKHYEWLVKGQLKRLLPELNEVDDLYQDTLLESYRSLHSYSHRGRFPSWLIQIACRVAYRHCRVAARDRAMIREYMQTRGNTQSLPFDAWFNEEGIHILLATLGGVDRMLIEYRYFEGLAPSEIAERMEWEPTRVRVRIHRILKRLRDEWEATHGG
ncbi:MAG: sigma-70 family RNA polymerase sigma factor [Candidatus Hydrogenedentes bacterium]|nr:sigma-70 family RNA polymerase sigma factor [Candidatus Hydrogenedentota bacterium]